ncbi:MAG: carbamoyltransferase HypF [Planctomycetota bacterium]|nr:carbamoyltransferase HypF [Planctomycetota bacterium]MDA2986102.1 carbamoyltransferase HypF [Actinomycetota bacterium]
MPPKESPEPPRALRIRVRGVVQGVGFRPMVWRVANEEGVRGYVANDGEGVIVLASGSREAVSRMLLRIQSEAPLLAKIAALEVEESSEEVCNQDFTIRASQTGENQTRVTADASICAECLAEIADPDQRRFRYPFANCTQCGPRFSIVEEVPYDRARTTMRAFPMCDACRAEYTNPADRRFHAQPIACAECGPRVWIEYVGDSERPQPQTSDEDSLRTATDLLLRGWILAIKGLGGFHLACDATNADAVARLRARKRRYGKPFALMASSVEVIRRFCSVSPEEEALLTSASTPIVLLQANGPEKLPAEIAPGIDSLGFMLPYTPLHVLLLDGVEQPVVMTSGNLSSEPQITAVDEARQRLGSIADAIVMHDREIANRIDDSVARVVAGEARMLRVARGYAPAAFELPPGFDGAPDLVAFGGELKSTFCLLKDGVAVMSQHQGDLEDVATFDDFRHNMRLYREIYDHEPELIVADRHPEYVSSKLAREVAQESGLPLADVQHHHAHVASCMAENGLPLESAVVLGIAMDGLGYGDDGTIWGGEFLMADYRSAQRIANLRPIPMIGGAQSIMQPWRSTYAHLCAAGLWSAFATNHPGLDLCRALRAKPLTILDQMVAQGVNAPLASSCGRLFDAVAAALGICRDQVTFEGQGAIELEARAEAWLALPGIEEIPYPFAVSPPAKSGRGCIDPGPMWAALLADLGEGLSVGHISARFHLGLVAAICEMACLIREFAGPEVAPTSVILTGGCFQNSLLLARTQSTLESQGFRSLSHARLPANDGGLALGQAAVAAARWLDSGCS